MYNSQPVCSHGLYWLQLFFLLHTCLLLLFELLSGWICGSNRYVCVCVRRWKWIYMCLSLWVCSSQSWHIQPWCILFTVCWLSQWLSSIITTEQHPVSHCEGLMLKSSIQSRQALPSKNTGCWTERDTSVSPSFIPISMNIAGDKYCAWKNLICNLRCHLSKQTGCIMELTNHFMIMLL